MGEGIPHSFYADVKKVKALCGKQKLLQEKIAKKNEGKSGLSYLLAESDRKQKVTLQSPAPLFATDDEHLIDAKAGYQERAESPVL
jgi:hypothetical protein